MVEIGAWRTLKNANGENPVDIARKKKHQRLFQLLEPVYKEFVPHETLQKIQNHFHSIILGRTRDLVEKYGLRLPELELLLEIDQPRMWFPVPGMCGGFSYWLALLHEREKDTPFLDRVVISLPLCSCRACPIELCG